MQYNDEALPSNESMSNMRQSYTKLSPVNVLKVNAMSEKYEMDVDIFRLYNKEIELLKNLSNYSQNIIVRDYLRGLAEKGQAELEIILKNHPEIDMSLDDNPIIYNRRNNNQNFKDFLDIDLDIISKLSNTMQYINKEEYKTITKFITRHTNALKELFKLMHLITFY